MGKPVIIDCDPGVDDVLALLLAFASPELDVKAVTAVAGNVSVEHTARNALAVCELLGASCPVAAGANAPLVGKRHEAPAVHGVNGIGGVELSVTGSLAPLDGISLLYQELKQAQGQLEIIATGPLTNVALLLKQHPDSKSLIKKISLMGGALEGGNVTPFAEFNFYADPLAADRVLRSGVPVDMYGLDVTNWAVLLPEKVDEIASWDSPVLKPVLKMIDHYQSFYQSLGFKGIKLHDPLAVAGAFCPEFTGKKAVSLGVECKDEEHWGQVLNEPENSFPVQAAVELEEKAFLDFFMERMKYWSRESLGAE